MKIRKGFISNSSSSSFLIYGFFTEDLPEAILDKYNEIKWEEFEDNVYGYDSDICGVSVCNWEGYEVLDPTIMVECINSFPKYKEELKRKFKEIFNYELPEKVFKLIAATYYD